MASTPLRQRLPDSSGFQRSRLVAQPPQDPAFTDFDYLRARLRAGLNDRASSPKRSLLATAGPEDTATAVKGAGARSSRIDELQHKLQLILGHNTALLEQVAQLNALLEEKSMLVTVLEGQISAGADGSRLLDRVRGTSNRESDRLINQLRAQVQRLNNQSRHWKQQCAQLQRSRALEISSVRKKYDNERYQTLNLLRRSQNETKDEYQVTILKLKEMLSMKDFQLEEASKKHLQDISRLSEEVDYLNDLLRHRQALKEGELKDLVTKYENQLSLLQQEDRAKMEVARATSDRQIARLKAQANARAVQVSQLQNRVVSLGQFGDKENRKQSLQKQKLRLELQNLVSQSLQAIEAERTKERQIAKVELESLGKNARQRQSLLLLQNQKLRQLLDHKVRQLGTAHKQMDSQRNYFLSQGQAYEGAIAQLKDRISQIITIEQIEKESLKVKFAEVSQADVRTLVAQLQRQGEDLTSQLRTRQAQLQDKGQKLEAALKEKMTVRRAYELQLQQVRAQKQGLQTKLQALRSEMDDQMRVMQESMTVQTSSLQRDRDTQRHGLSSVQEEKKKLLGVIAAKDNQIAGLNEKYTKAKLAFDEQRKLLQTRIAQREALFAQMDAMKGREIAGLKSDLAKKDASILAQQQAYQQKILELQKAIEDGLRRAEQLQRQVLLQQRSKQDALRRIKQLEKLMSEMNRHNQRIAVQANNSHGQQLLKSKAITQRKESKLVQGYQAKISRLERDIADLRTQLGQRQEQMCHWRNKAHQLQLKLGNLAQSSTKLRGIQQKVLSLGIDKGLLKNMQDLFKTKAV